MVKALFTNPAPEATLTAGADLIAGQCLCASGSYVVPATAASGVNALSDFLLLGLPLLQLLMVLKLSLI